MAASDEKPDAKLRYMRTYDEMIISEDLACYFILYGSLQIISGDQQMYRGIFVIFSKQFKILSTKKLTL